MENEYITISIRMPKELCDWLDAQAANQSRNRSQQLTYVLKELSHAHAPPVTTQIKSRANGVSRKQKTKATA
jgi:predicted DNA-binding protein